MKDCKWNPPTARAKGIHFSPDGAILDRRALNDVEDGTVLLKLVELTGNSKVRRTAARQVEQWRKDGTLDRIISGEIDPPENWVRHIRHHDLDKASVKELMTSSEGLVSGETLVLRTVGALFYDAYDGGPYDDSPLFSRAYPEGHAQRANLLQASLTTLVREGRLTKDDLKALHERTQSFVDANQNKAVVGRAFDLSTSPLTATELAVRHGSFLLLLDPKNPDDVKKADLLRHARTSFDSPSWSSLVDPSEVLNHAFSSQTAADTLSDLSNRLHLISKSAGPYVKDFNRLRNVEEMRTNRRAALELLSVLHDPLDQRALAVVLATVSTHASGDPTVLANATPNLPDGTSDLDRLTRAVAVGLKDGRIHGDPKQASKLALDVLAGRDIPADTTITAKSDWHYGTLGALSVGALTQRARPDANVTEILRQASSSMTHWDTIVLPERPDPREVLAAVALRQARRNDGQYDGMALGRLNAISGEKQSLRDIAETAVQQAVNRALPENISATLALALISDAKHAKPSRDLIETLDAFSATGHTPSVSNYEDLPAATVISDLMEEARRYTTSNTAPDAIRPELPPRADRLAARLRAAVGKDVGCIADAYIGDHGPHFEHELHVPFASDANVPALISHVRKALERTPRRDTRTTAAEREEQEYKPRIWIRENELVVTHYAAFDARAVVLESLREENVNPYSSLLVAPRKRIVMDPEFARLLDEEEARFPTPAPDLEAQRREAERQAALAAGKGDPEFERLLNEE